MQIGFYELPKNWLIVPDKVECYFFFYTSYKLPCTYSFRSVNNLASNVLTDELSFLNWISPITWYSLQHHGTKQQKIIIIIIIIIIIVIIKIYCLHFLLFPAVKAYDMI